MWGPVPAAACSKRQRHCRDCPTPLLTRSQQGQPRITQLRIDAAVPNEIVIACHQPELGTCRPTCAEVAWPPYCVYSKLSERNHHKLHTLYLIGDVALLDTTRVLASAGCIIMLSNGERDLSDELQQPLVTVDERQEDDDVSQRKKRYVSCIVVAHIPQHILRAALGAAAAGSSSRWRMTCNVHGKNLRN